MISFTNKTSKIWTLFTAPHSTPLFSDFVIFFNIYIYFFFLCISHHCDMIRWDSGQQTENDWACAHACMHAGEQNGITLLLKNSVFWAILLFFLSTYQVGIFFFFLIFFNVDLCWISCSIASAFCFDFLATGHVGSLLPNQGLNPHTLHWKIKS